MRFLTIAASLLVAGSAAVAQDFFETIYCTSYDNGLVTLTLEYDSTNDSYSLTKTDENYNCGSSPSWLTLDRKHSFLYCLDEGLLNNTGFVSSYFIPNTNIPEYRQSIDTVHGPVAAVQYGDSLNQALAVTHRGGEVFSTYGTPGNGELTYLELINLKMNMTMNMNMTTNMTMSQPDNEFIHQPLLGPYGSYMATISVASNEFKLFAINEIKNKLIPGPVPDTANQHLKDSGPWQGVFWRPIVIAHFELWYLFIVGEYDSKVTAYRIEIHHHIIAIWEWHSETKIYGDYKDMTNGTQSGGIAVSPDNEYLIISSHHDENDHDFLSTFYINSNGTLSYLNHTSSGGLDPRTFELNAEGSLIVVANAGSGRASVLQRDADSGQIGGTVAAMDGLGELTSCLFG